MKEHYKWLSALRGLCALLVVLRHMIPYFTLCRDSASLGPVSFLMSRIVDSGKIGVVGFFLISGFLVPAHLNTRTRKQFILNRAIRLYPTYWFSIILAVILVGGFSLVQILANATMFQMYLGIEDVVGVYWTLPIEVLFYIGCLVIYKQIRETKIKAIDLVYLLIALAALLVCFARYRTGIKLPAAVPLLILTSVAGYYVRLHQDGSIGRGGLYGRLIFYLTVVLPCCVLAYNADMGFDEKWYIYFLSYLSGLLLFLAFKALNVRSKLFSWVGGISYSLYLTHRIFISFLCDGGQRISWLYLLFVFAVIMVAAYFTNLLVEKKTYSLLNRLLARAGEREQSHA